MEKPVVAIEVTSKNIKMVIGYELRGQIYVIYSLCRALNHAVNLDETGDSQLVSETLESLSHINDTSAHLEINFSEALVALPPNGLEVYQVNQTTSVTSSAQEVCPIDINNIYNIIRNGSLPISENELIDIVPSAFILEGGRVFHHPPFGEISRQVSVNGSVHTLPRHLINSYLNCFKMTGIKVKRNMVAPYAAIELLGSYKETPNDYFLVDMGASYTSVSLVGNKQLFASRVFPWGGDAITEKIILNFNINEAEAEKYKRLYGISSSKFKFNAPICKTDDGYGNEISHYPEDLNKIITSELDRFVKLLNTAIDDLLKRYKDDYKKLPLIIIGGSSQIIGLKDYIAPKLLNESITCYIPKSFGARDPSLFSCLGMIYANAHYPLIAIEENQPKVGTVTREVKNGGSKQ